MPDRRQFIRYSLVGTGAAIAVLVAAKIGYKFNHFEKLIYTFSLQT